MCSICVSLASSLSTKHWTVDVIPADVAVVPGRAPGWSYDDGQGFLDLDERGGFGTNGMTSFTTEEAAVQLNRSGRSWSGALGTPATITYGFRSTDPGVGYNGGTAQAPGNPEGFSRMNELQILATELLLAAWADVAGLTFTRIGSGTTGEGAYTDSATMLFANYSENDSAAAFAYLAGNASTSNLAASGDVWVNLFGANRTAYNGTPTYLAYGYQTLVHEIGHALGLSHPGDYNAGQGNPTYADATYYEDTRQYSVMSYWAESNSGANFGAGRYASAPLLDDIAAAQRMYGANMTTRTGDTVYGFNSNAGRIWYDATQGGAAQAVIFSVWDAGGNDTLDFSGYAQAGVIDLRQGHFSSVGGLSGNVSIALGAVIEQAIGGSGGDTIVGNAAANLLRGNGGDDIIDGGVGQDTAVFSGASGAYTITASTETVDGVTYQVLLVTGADGADRLYNIELLQFSNGTIAVPAAAAAGIRLEGDRTDNTLTGTAYADRLFGAGGNDTLNAGAGDDVLISGRGSDTLNGGDGVDTADYSSFTGALTINLATGTTTKPAGEGGGTDTLSGIENVRGTVYSDTITGDGGANRIEGGGGVDTLNGGGGADTLIAGAGVTTAPPAPDVVKAQGTANISIATAVNIDANFDISADAGFTNPTTVPHAKINATTNGGGKEYYAFTVGAGVTATFDINGGTFDTVIEIFDAGGNRLAINDDGGSDSTNSYLSHLFSQAGTYYIAVSRWVSGSGTGIVMDPPPAGGTYGLNISIPGHAVSGLTLAGSTLNGGDGDDILHSGSGDDTLNGGANSDTAVYAGARSAYTITDLGGGSYRVTGPNGTGTDTLNGMEFIQFSDQLYSLVGNVATTGDDVLTGTEGDDVIDGLAGNDTISGLGGADTLRGGLGADRLYGEAGNDTLYGDDGDDILVGWIGNDILNGGAGADFLYGEDGDDVMSGGEGLDYLYGGTGADLLYGEEGNDFLYGDDGDDTLVGWIGNDYLNAGAGADLLYGEDGADELHGGDGNDRLYGGADNDSVDAGSGDDFLYGEAGDDVMGGGFGLDYLYGGDGNDRLYGEAGDDFVYGDDGEDILVGWIGNDYLNGGAGADLLYGEDGNDEIHGGDGNDRIYAGADNDTVDAGSGDDFLYGEAGDDLMGGGFGVDYLYGGIGADRLYGEVGDDFLYGDDGDDILVGWLGNDYLNGGAGGDLIYGEDGNDEIHGGDGNDRIYAGADNDTVDAGSGDDFLYGEAGDDLMGGGFGVDYIYGGIGADRLYGEVGDDFLYGEDGDDILVGWLGNDYLNGGAGADLIYGEDGNDEIYGGDGNDRIYAGADNDTIDAGAGDDQIWGEGGNDRFLFAGAHGNDIVRDFSAGAGLGDVLVLSGFSSFAEVLANTADDGQGNTVINHFGQTITLTGVLRANLAADDFELSGAAFGDTPLILPSVEASQTDKGQEPLILPDILTSDEPLILPTATGPGGGDDWWKPSLEDGLYAKATSGASTGPGADVADTPQVCFGEVDDGASLEFHYASLEFALVDDRARLHRAESSDVWIIY